MDCDWTESTTASCADVYCSAMAGDVRIAVLASSCRFTINNSEATADPIPKKT